MLSLQAGALTQRDPSNSQRSHGWSNSQGQPSPQSLIFGIKKGKSLTSYICTNILEGETGERKEKLNGKRECKALILAKSFRYTHTHSPLIRAKNKNYFGQDLFSPPISPSHSFGSWS